ncbi:MAG: VOC family protein [Fimbriimonadales bacterium]
MITGFGLVFAFTADMDTAVAFYRDVLGLTPKMVSPYWSEFDVNGTRLALHPGANGSVGGWTTCLATEDLAALRERVKAAGSPQIGEYHQTPGGVIFEFHDLDGNQLQAIQNGTKIEQFTS